MDPYLGQILLVPYNFAPAGWHFCDGTLLPISQYNALFALLGTTYGGNGQSTFALPDLRGRVPVGSGQGTGLQSYTLGEQGGQETVTLIQSEMPMHTHLVTASVGSGADIPTDNFIGGGAGVSIFDSAANVTMNPMMVSAAGGSQAHENRAPYQALNYIIALTGIYPSRG